MANRYVRRPDGTTGSIPHDVVIPFNYDILGNTVDTWVFVADADYELVGARCVPVVAGSDGGAVTADVVKASGTTAAGSGTTMLTSTFDLKATANTLINRTLTATLADRRLAAGDRVGINFTGTTTAAVGYIQLNLKRVQAPGEK